MSDAQPHFFDLTPTQLDAFVASLKWPRFRAKQVAEWVYSKLVVDPMQMTNLTQRDRELLAERMTFAHFTIADHQVATDGTQKLLLELAANPQSASRKPQYTECVMIPAESPTGTERRTACISSQVGCPVGCRFCASGLGGLERNLTAGEVLEQVYWLNTLPALRDAGERITNIVFMGMGEPLSNYAAVTAAVRTLNAEWGFGISGRRITISTVGLPAQMRRLADAELPPITLAISLHAPNDEVRRRIIPWAQFTSIEQIIDAGRYYFDKTGREVTIEYILLGGVNDSPEQAAELATVAKRLRCNVNLIRYNEVRGLPFDRPGSDGVHRFQTVLRNAGVNTHIRASRGRDIAAACGQLRHEKAANSA